MSGFLSEWPQRTVGLPTTGPSGQGVAKGALCPYLGADSYRII